MKIGVVIGTNEAEAVWNALRFGVTSLKAGHGVKVFLISQGGEIETIEDRKYNVREQLGLFIANNGQLLACGTCLESRSKAGSAACPISTMKDLLGMVEESDRLLTFG
jgi:uncharacterized protein involved in oxidation of intracellular sulfur